jgi:hypothetical protein
MVNKQGYITSGVTKGTSTCLSRGFSFDRVFKMEFCLKIADGKPRTALAV